ncbi:hypothetical protein [Candidatus Palauibacter sp.]|uniref:hypothetical protein n=1 Tax=Candidatus Palauibacter sp. TaxID=3101350 RepID=UPI003B5A910B
MNVVVHDNASPPNEASTTFTFIRDMTPIETPVMRAWVNKGAPSSCGEDAEDFCFTIDTEDSAVDENDHGPGNTAADSAVFSVVLDAAPTGNDDPSNP